MHFGRAGRARIDFLTKCTNFLFLLFLNSWRAFWTSRQGQNPLFKKTVGIASISSSRKNSVKSDSKRFCFAPAPILRARMALNQFWLYFYGWNCFEAVLAVKTRCKVIHSDSSRKNSGRDVSGTVSAVKTRLEMVRSYSSRENSGRNVSGTFSAGKTGQESVFHAGTRKTRHECVCDAANFLKLIFRFLAACQKLFLYCCFLLCFGFVLVKSCGGPFSRPPGASFQS